MILDSLRLYRVEIPFRAPFEHASARRETTESVWVEARSAHGHVGHGEGCPRGYVTGEDLSSAASFFAAHRGAWLERIHTLQDLRRWTEEHRELLDENPAAWCAVELALLDVLAREDGRSVERLLGVRELRGEYRYTAVVGERGRRARAGDDPEGTGSSPSATSRSSSRAHADRDREVLREVLAGDDARDVRVRADFNNAFPEERRAAAYLDALEVPLFAVEEPLHASRYAPLARLAERAEVPIVLDESLLRTAQLDALPGPPERWIVNLRVSKMGGALALARAPRAGCAPWGSA